MKGIFRIGLGVFMVVSVASAAWAQGTPTLFTGGARRLEPVRVAPIDAHGRLLGPWKAYTPQPQFPQTPNWQVAFDCYEGDATGVPSDTIYGPSLGLGSQRYFSGEFFRNPYISNDMTLATGTGGLLAQRLQIAWFWNPPAPEALIVLAFATDKFGQTDAGPSWSTGFHGVALDFGVTAGSPDYFYSDVDLRSTSDSMALPSDGSGAIVLYYATLVSGNFAPATLAQPMQWGTRWSGNPSYPGTNPSRSDQWQWDDDNPTDFDHTTGPLGERYGYDLGALVPPRILGGMAGLFVDANAEMIGGTIVFEGIDPGTTRPIDSATFYIRVEGNPLDIVSVQTVSIPASGQFRLAAPTTPGNYTISCIDSHFLRRSVGPVTTTGSPGVRSAPVMNMINGNVDADDPGAIDIADFALLSQAFGTERGDPDFYENADLNRDDAIDIGDYAILSGNFGAEGDE